MAPPTGLVTGDVEILGVTDPAPSPITIRKGDYGWTLRLTVKEKGLAVGIGNMTLPKSLRLICERKPDIKRRDLVLVDGPNGVVEYVVAAGDFDCVARWRAHVFVKLPGGLNVLSEGLVIDVDRIGD